MRHAAKRDACEPVVVAELRRERWTVLPVSSTDWPDLFCVRAGVVLLVECKKLGGALRPGQAKLHARLHAAGFLVAVAGNATEAHWASHGTPIRTYQNMSVETRGTRGPRGVKLNGAHLPRVARGSRRTTSSSPATYRPGKKAP